MLTKALERARRAAGLSGGAVMVGFSGGKDALATLDITVRSGAFQRIEAFAMYLVRGLECFEDPIQRFCDSRRVPVHFVPHWDLSRLLKHAVLRPHVPGAESLRIMKLRDVEAALTHDTGIDWFAYGERADDSYARRLYTRKVDGVHPEWRRLWPIWDWKTAHVLAYLRARRIPAPDRIGATRSAGGSGITLDPLALVHLKGKYPRDYQRILEVFPGAEAQVLRAQRGDFDPVPSVHHDPAPPPASERGQVQPKDPERGSQEEASTLTP